MSPASAGALEVERYIGACLISQNRSKNTSKARDYFHRPQVYPRNGYVNLQGCPQVDGWAGGVPLISFAGHPRRARLPEHEEITNNHLARLAVHTQGAPLILAKSYNHRKSKPQRNNYNNNANNNNNTNSLQQTKIFENSGNKKLNKIQETVSGCVKGVDAISVTSDESSGSQNSETCLPRIIKPRKRRKKDRKPPHLNRPQNQDGFSTDSASPDIDTTTFTNYSPFLSYFEPRSYQPPLPEDNKQLLDLLSDLSETPKLHHSFEDVEEVKDVNGNQPTSMCQCRYCDPAGQIWDVDRSCYSPFLTPPKSFEFPSLFNSFPTPVSDDYGLLHSMSVISLEDDKYKPSFSRSSSSSSNSSSSSSIGDLEVSTEIVTSLNGHRDLEIKFWLNSAVDSKSTKDKKSDNCEKT